MKYIHRLTLLPLIALAQAAIIAPALAEPAPRLENFKTGPIFNDFGPTTAIDSDVVISPDSQFQVSFDVADAATPGQLNRSIESAARFINMHVAAGVPEQNIRLAIVVHGGAVDDLTNAQFYASRHDGSSNGSAAAIAELQQHGVAIYICGQSAAAHGVTKADLLPGVEMSLSAMTSHALLQQQGYTLNPF